MDGYHAISLYKAIVLVFRSGSDSNFFRVANVVAWGIPAIIVIVTGAVEPGSMAPDEIKRYCFVYGVDGYPFYFGVLLPVAFVILMNLIILILVMVSLKRKPPVSSTKEQKNQTAEQCRIAVSCCVLLGLTWVFGLFAVGKATRTFQILFCIFNAFQGFVIFLLYTIKHPIVRKEMKIRFRCFGMDDGTSFTSPSNQTSTEMIEQSKT